MSESGRSYFPREGEFDFGFMVVHPSKALKPREISQGAHCHKSSLPSPPHHVTVPKLTMASHPHATCTSAPPSHTGVITAPSYPSTAPSSQSHSTAAPSLACATSATEIFCLSYCPHTSPPHLSPITASKGSCSLSKTHSPSSLQSSQRQTASSGRILDRLSFFPS